MRPVTHRARVHRRSGRNGGEVRRHRVGDRVVVCSFIGCGRCWYCANDLWSLCDNSNTNPGLGQVLFGYETAGIFGYSHAMGGFRGSHAEYVRVPFADHGAFPVPEGIDDTSALFASDSAWMGAHLGEVWPGDVVAVWGCGAVGQMAARAAMLLGAERVISIDRFPERLPMTEQHVGSETIDYTDTDVATELRERTGEDGGRTSASRRWVWRPTSTARSTCTTRQNHHLVGPVPGAYPFGLPVPGDPRHMGNRTNPPGAAPAVRRVLPSRTGPGRLLGAMDSVERSPRADAVVQRLQHWTHALPLGRGRDFLHGRWLGHPVHPLMVQLPIGAWLSTAVLDAIPGERRGSSVLTAVGLIGAGPAAVAGLVDWADLHRQQMRVGLLHAAANATAVGLYTASLTARVRGRERLGRTLAFAGLAAVSTGGALGGHMAYRQASGANHAEDVPHLITPGWHLLGDVADFPVGEPVHRTVEEVAVLVVRDPGGTVRVLADHCSHLGGPLSQGTVVDGCVQCPWHGTTFRLSDGWNVSGPATAPQPAFDTQVTDGHVRVRLRD